jgi:hypothetical protein
MRCCVKQRSEMCMNSGLVTISYLFACRFDLETFHVFKTLCTILQGNCGIEIGGYFDGVKHWGLGRHKWKASFHVLSYCKTMSS